MLFLMLEYRLLNKCPFLHIEFIVSLNIFPTTSLPSPLPRKHFDPPLIVDFQPTKYTPSLSFPAKLQITSVQVPYSIALSPAHLSQTRKHARIQTNPPSTQYSIYMNLCHIRAVRYVSSEITVSRVKSYEWVAQKREHHLSHFGRPVFHTHM